MRLDFSVSAHKERRRDLVRELKDGSFRLGGFYSTLSALRFREIVRGRLRGLRPLDAVRGRAVTWLGVVPSEASRGTTISWARTSGSARLSVLAGFRL
jgi:hypothetical protein